MFGGNARSNTTTLTPIVGRWCPGLLAPQFREFGVPGSGTEGRWILAQEHQNSAPRGTREFGVKIRPSDRNFGTNPQFWRACEKEDYICVRKLNFQVHRIEDRGLVRPNALALRSM